MRWLWGGESVDKSCGLKYKRENNNHNNNCVSFVRDKMIQKAV